MPPFTPTPPPWHLWSPPPCTRYTITDLDALLDFCVKKGLHSTNMQVLVGHKQGNTTGAQGGKAHEAGWVFWSEQEVKWLSHPSLGCAVPTCGPTRGKGGGELFLDLVAPKLGAPFTKSKEMFMKLLHGKEHKGKKLEHILQWRIVPKPPDAEGRFPCVVVQVCKLQRRAQTLPSMLASPLVVSDAHPSRVRARAGASDRACCYAAHRRHAHRRARWWRARTIPGARLPA
jgi:hypothetical protein